MTYTPVAGQIWPQGQPRQGQKNRFFRALPSGEYTLEGYQQPFSTDAIITDPDFDKVTLLLDMEGTAGSASFVDRSDAANTITAVSGAVISNTRTKFGSGSFSNNNQGRYLQIGSTANLSFPGDFTIEVWFWAEASQPSYPTVFEIGQYTNGILFRPYHSGGGLWINGSNYGDFLNETLIPKQQWNHAAFVRSGTTFVCYLNGQVDKTATISGTINSASGPSRIGSSTHTSGQHLNGYIDEVRVTNGLARYSAPFTPPTEPFPLQGGSEPEPPPEPETPVFSVSAITYTQSSIYGGTAPVSNQIMTDGSFTNTGAATNSGAGQFVQMNLGGVFSVDRIVIGTATSSIPGGWNKSYTENRTIQHSIDGTAWTNTFNIGTFAADGIYTFNVNIEARYIRIISTSNSWIAISEFYALAAEPGTDPYLSSVSLLLHMDGSNGSTVFTDSSANSITVTGYGNAQISTAQSRFGASSAYFDGSGDYLSTASSLAPLQMGTGDFTVEAFIRPTASVAGYRGLIGLQSTDIDTLYILAGALVWYNSGTGAGAIAVDTWYHVAASRQGTNLRVFLDGVLVNTSTNSNNMTFGRLRVGSNGANTGEFFQGWMDELRVTKGVARYIANFAPPTAPFPDS